MPKEYAGRRAHESAERLDALAAPAALCPWGFRGLGFRVLGFGF